ncbi:NAD(P)/FAD-dependent oxidoreductase [Oceaniglobus ichthyenteri]|uniref:NAD(P)/FAD-dependent oxidoreductase n=1 Tax=Oceaniglobus ichthyenteri TaxID=2136177 RepID=UPI000D3A8147|nr:FAD-binding oxidoreductase [Oceaniglobus ichthyenteri]
MSDIIVIGGGIAGVSAAAALSRDAHVTLIEAEPHLAYHASGRSAAMFLQDYGNDTVRALNRASAAHLHDNGILRQRGVMLLARTDQHDSFVIENAAFGLTELDLDTAQSLFPILNRASVAHAGYRPDVHDLDTDLLIQGYRKQALAQGAVFETGARISEIHRDQGRWHVTWPGGSAQADMLVNAAGAWADNVAQMAGVTPLGLQPYRRSMAVMAPPGGHDVTDWPFVDGVDEGWYAKPDAGQWLVSPCEEHALSPQDAWADDMVLAEGLERYQEMVTEPVTRITHNWAGLRTFAPDRALVIGADGQVPGFYWLAGQGGYGFQTAPAAAQLLGDLVNGRPPMLEASAVAALSPRRFA